MTNRNDLPPLDDCWNRIGVRGDASCPELKEVVHCRNCPVHAGAAAGLLDGALPPGRRDEWAAHFARKEDDAEDLSLSVFLFRIGPEWLALPTAVFQETAALRPIHSLPSRRGGGVLGIVNIRGELLICASLARLLGLEEASGTPETKGGAARGEHRRELRRLLVASGEGGRLAFPVDEVHGIHRFRPGALRETPATLANAAASYARGVLPWRDASAGLLDEGPLFAALNRNLT